jgi:hypothetical protein
LHRAILVKLLISRCRAGTLRNYVKIWDREDGSKTASPLVDTQTYQLPIQSSPSSAIGGPQINPPTQGGTPRALPRENMMGLQVGSLPGPQFGSEMATHTSPPNRDGSMHYSLPYGNLSPFSQGLPSNCIDPLLLALRNGIQNSDTESYQNIQFTRNSTGLRQTEFHMEDTARASSKANGNIANPRAGFVGQSVEVVPVDSSSTEYTTEVNPGMDSYSYSSHWRIACY